MTSQARYNQFVARIERGEAAVGGFLQSGDTYAARGAGDSDLDFVIVDMEHQGFGFHEFATTLQWLLSPRRGRRTGGADFGPTPFLRVPASGVETPDWMVKHALDCGASGLVIPWTQTAEQVERVIRAARFSQGSDGPEPQGHRGVFSFNAAARYWGSPTFEEYVERADLWPLAPSGEVSMLFLVEDPVGVANIEGIVRVPGVAGVIYGRGDHAPFVHHDADVLDAAESAVLAACTAAGVPAGTVGRDQQAIANRISAGWTFVITDHFVRFGLPGGVHLKP